MTLLGFVKSVRLLTATFWRFCDFDRIQVRVATCLARTKLKPSGSFTPPWLTRLGSNVPPSVRHQVDHNISTNRLFILIPIYLVFSTGIAPFRDHRIWRSPLSLTLIWSCNGLFSSFDTSGFLFQIWQWMKIAAPSSNIYSSFLEKWVQNDRLATRLS